MQYELRKILDIEKDYYLQILKDLVACDTRVIGHGIDVGTESRGQQYLASVLSPMGAILERDQVTEAVIQKAIAENGEGNPGHNLENRYNLIATFPGSGGGRSLLFNGHVDTMPEGDSKKWSADPFVATEKDGLLYGLGVSDMKAGLVAPICAMKLLAGAGLSPLGDVRIVSVVDEEGGGNGSVSATMNGYNADAAIVCEPTGTEIVTAAMGFVFFKVTVRGKSLHSGYKWQGVSAIDKAIVLIHALEALEHQWLMEYKHPLLPSPTLNVGVIEGGSAGSTVPQECTFKLCLHYIPTVMTYEKVVEDVTHALTTRAQGDAWLRQNPPEISVYQAGGGFEIGREHAFVRAVSGAAQAVFGKASLAVSAAGNDARAYHNIAKIPVLVFGPGSVGHMPDEYLPIRQFYDMILAYAQVIIDWCGITPR